MLEAELNASDPVARAAIVVEYGPVEIGDKTYICPLKSFSSTLAETLQFNTQYLYPMANRIQPLKTMVNEDVFEQYHLFRTDARVVTGDDAETKPANAESAPTEAAKLAEAAAQPAAPAAPVAGTGTAPVSPSTPAPEQEIAAAEASGVPDAPASPSLPQTSGFTLRVASRLVDVGVVAYDKKGHPVKDLTPEDFEIYDNGRKQEVRYFSQAAAPAPSVLPDQPAASSGQPNFSNRGSSEANAPVKKPESSVTILLLDGSNLAFGDLTYARGQALQFLRNLPANERVGLYAMKRTGFQVLAEETADHALLVEKLGRWMPSAQDLANAQDEEQRNRQQINEVHNVSDLGLVNGNTSPVTDTMRTASSLDPALRDWGSNPGRDAMMILVGVARHLAAIPGHKNLVWVSSDNALADWSNQAVSIEKGDKYIESNTLRAQEAMNDAHVSVYPLDASQLESGTIDASTQHRNVELTPAALDNAVMAGKSGSQTSLDGLDISVGRDMRPGRITAQMQQDLHSIQGPVRHLAEATGGRVFRRSGSIATELNGVVEDGHAAYLLSFTPDLPADNTFHLITVKLAAKRPGLTLHYRTGYLYAKEPGTLKERFQQAVWLPVDANQVAVTASVAAAAAGADVKIVIAAGDLGLAESAGRWTDKLDIFFIQRDDAGLHAQIEGQTLGLRLQSSTYQKLLASGVPCERIVPIKPATSSLRILVVDENTGRMGSVTIPASALQTVHGG
jgi:VWFA-related protein